MPNNRCKTVHKYRRFRLNPGDNPRKKFLFRCIRCPHYLVGKEMIIGRECECWVCGRVFQMTEKTLQLKPHCGCKNKDNDENKNELLSILMEVMNNVS